jgi:hypothetical protein
VASGLLRGRLARPPWSTCFAEEMTHADKRTVRTLDSPIVLQGIRLAHGLAIQYLDRRRAGAWSTAQRLDEGNLKVEAARTDISPRGRLIHLIDRTFAS